MVYETTPTVPYKIRYERLLPDEEIEVPSADITNAQILGDLALKWIFIGAGAPGLPVVPGAETVPMYSTTLVTTAAVTEAGDRLRKAV